MMNPTAIMLPLQGRQGLREVFCFRAVSADGRMAFWLRHALLRRKGQQAVTVECSLAAFDRKTGEVECIFDREEISPAVYRQFAQGGNWDAVSFNFSSGSFFEIRRDGLRGKLHTSRGSAAWDLLLERSDQTLFPLPGANWYRLAVPGGKQVTRDCRLQANGRLSCAGMVLTGSFLGSNQHLWGRGLAIEQAHAGCNRFREDDTAFFEGGSMRLAVAGEWLQTPWFCLASLYAGGKWHHFNQWQHVARQTVDALDNYRWLAMLSNDSHRLEIAVDGANPRVEPWLALHYDSPGARRAVAKYSMFAAGRLRLFGKDGGVPLLELSSEFFDLETLLPGNIPMSKGLVGHA